MSTRMLTLGRSYIFLGFLRPCGLFRFVVFLSAVFLSMHWTRLGEAQTNLPSSGGSLGRAFELVILDRSGLTRYSASVRGATELVVTVASAQVDGLLTHVDGLSAPIRGTRVDAGTIRFASVAPGTWRVSLVTPGTDTQVPGVKILSIRGE